MVKVATKGAIRIEKIFSLSDGEHRFGLVNNPTEIGLQLENFEQAEVFDKEVCTDVTVNRTGTTFYIQLTVQTEASLFCDRCLRPVSLPISGEHAFCLTHEPGVADDDEMRQLNVNKNALELDQDVRNALLLTIPGKILCKEDCKGLCDQCGANLNESSCIHASETKTQTGVTNG